MLPSSCPDVQNLKSHCLQVSQQQFCAITNSASHQLSTIRAIHGINKSIPTIKPTVFPQNISPGKSTNSPQTEPRQDHIPCPQTRIHCSQCSAPGDTTATFTTAGFITPSATLHSLKIGYFLLHCVDSSPQSPSADFMLILDGALTKITIISDFIVFPSAPASPIFHMDSLLTAVLFLIIPQLQAHSNTSNSFHFTNQVK